MADKPAAKTPDEPVASPATQEPKKLDLRLKELRLKQAPMEAVIDRET